MFTNYILQDEAHCFEARRGHDQINSLHHSSSTQDEFYIPPIKLGDVTEFFVLALAHVQALRPAPALAGLCESTRCAFQPLRPLWSTSDDHKAPLDTCRKTGQGGDGTDKHKGNQQIPFAWALRNIIGPNHHLFSFVKSLTAGLDKSEWKICRLQDAAKTFTDKSPPIEARCWFNWPIFINGIMITIIDWVILYQRATLLVAFNDSQMKWFVAEARWAFLVLCTTCRALITHQEGGPLLNAGAPGPAGSADGSCCRHQLSSWALSPSHGSLMRFNWCFSPTFVSFDGLNPFRKGLADHRFTHLT